MLFIVTPVFNRKDFTYSFLQSLKKQTYDDFKVIIVDDGSADNTWYEILCLEKKYSKQGLSILAISTDSQKSLSKVRSYIRTKKYSFDVMLDPNQQVSKKMI